MSDYYTPRYKLGIPRRRSFYERLVIWCNLVIDSIVTIPHRYEYTVIEVSPSDSDYEEAPFNFTITKHPNFFMIENGEYKKIDDKNVSSKS